MWLSCFGDARPLNEQESQRALLIHPWKPLNQRHSYLEITHPPPTSTQPYPTYYNIYRKIQIQYRFWYTLKIDPPGGEDLADARAVPKKYPCITQEAGVE